MAKRLQFPTVNNVIVSGRLTRDLELRRIPSGTAVVTLPIAFDRSYRDNDGNWQKESNFMDVIVWGSRAEVCDKYLSKGSPVMVEGSLRTRVYTTKDGDNRKIVEINAFRVHFLERNDDDSYASTGNVQNEKVEDKNISSEPIITDEDIPF